MQNDSGDQRPKHSEEDRVEAVHARQRPSYAALRHAHDRCGKRRHRMGPVCRTRGHARRMLCALNPEPSARTAGAVSIKHALARRALRNARHVQSAVPPEDSPPTSGDCDRAVTISEALPARTARLTLRIMFALVLLVILVTGRQRLVTHHTHKHLVDPARKCPPPPHTQRPGLAIAQPCRGRS